MVDISTLVRENVRKLTPYSCARDEYSGSDGIFMDANENPYGSLNRYPDPYQKELKGVISEMNSIPAGQIFLGNGSDEIIDLCFRIFCNPGVDKAITFTPTYGMYEVSAAVNDVEIIKIPLDENFNIDPARVIPLFSDRKLKLTFICSPNNPTGNSMEFSVVESIVSGFGGIVVIDEAYIDFSSKPSFIRLLDKYHNLIVMRTFSKASGLAAVRVGMAFTSPEIVGYFNKVKPPYNISTINQRTVLETLRKNGDNRLLVRKILAEREKLINNLRKLPVTIMIYPTDANFVLVRVTDANYIYNRLIESKIIVRNRTSVVNNCLRITVGKPSENNALIKALKSIEI